MCTLSNPLSFTEEQVVANLYIISSLKLGEKLICDEETGEIKVDDRVLFVSLRRGYYGAYQSSVVSRTFEEAIRLMKDHGVEYSITSHSYESGRQYKKLDQLFYKALEGLKILEKTYEDEGKNRQVMEIEERFKCQVQQLVVKKKNVRDLSADSVESLNTDIPLSEFLKGIFQDFVQELFEVG